MIVSNNKNERDNANVPSNNEDDVTAISDLLDIHVPFLEQEVREYISSYLMEQLMILADTNTNNGNENDSDDSIIEILEQFLGEYDNSQEILSKLVRDLKQSLQYRQQGYQNQQSKKQNHQQTGSPKDKNLIETNTESNGFSMKNSLDFDSQKKEKDNPYSCGDSNGSMGEIVNNKSKKANRKELRQQRRKQKQQAKNKKTCISKSSELENKNHQTQDDSQKYNNNNHDNTIDDHDSGWKDCQEQGIGWGGRGHGGRGIRVTENLDAIHLHSVSLTFAGNDLLTDSPMDIVRGRRYGLIGRNGVGKSTLLSKLSKSAIPGMPQGMRTLLVQQQIAGSDNKSAVDVLVQADVDRLNLLIEKDEIERRLEEGIDLEETAQRLGEIFDELDTIDADGAEQRAVTILKGLSFTEAMMYGPTSNLSGGWRMRLALARALFVPSSDLILFDECTNHLDLHGLDWLIRYIQESSTTMIVVSHDRSFLDGICTDIIVMEHQRLTYHVGNYSEYQRQMQDKASRETHILDAAARQRSKAVAFCQKQQAQANKKSADPNKQRQAKMIREKKLDRIGNYRHDGKRYKMNSLKKLDEKYVRIAQKVTIEADDPVLKLKFPNPTWPPGIGTNTALVQFEDVSFEYNNHNVDGNASSLTKNEKRRESNKLLSNVTFSLCRGDKVALVGRNGAGKSTLLRLLTGEVGTSDGKLTGNVRKHSGLRIGHVTQYSVEELEDYSNQTVVEYTEEKLVSGKASSSIIANASGNIRQYLGRFGLGGKHALRKIGKLSGGERMRLCFATVLADEPQLLVLDESTNHVDLETLDTMATALQAYEGAIIMVSHNQAFLSVFCKELWVLNECTGHVTINHSDTESFDTMFSEYRNNILSSGIGSASRIEQRRKKAEMAKRATKQKAGTKGTASLMT